MKSLIFIAPPAAGKGTQSEIISKKYNIPSISTGDLLRDARNQDNEIGRIIREKQDKGLLVDDEIVLNLLKNRLNESDCANGYILDGFPRTVSQAEALQEFLEQRGESLNTALLINVPNEFILERMTGRRVCPSCGASYHIKFNPPANGKCELCGTDIVQRKDDTAETVKERLDVYEKQTQPLIDYYSKNNLLSQVDGTKAINLVFESICDVLKDKEN